MSIENFIREMPKVELNVHLEGSIQKETLLIIAEQNEVNLTLKHFNQWVQLIEKPDYARLDEILATTCKWLQQPEDLTHAVYELGVSLAKQNVRYAEVTVTPTIYTENGMTFDDFLTAINDGRDRATRAWGVQMAWIFNIPRQQPRSSDEIIRLATGANAKRGGVIGIGLSGREDAQPAGQFERAFRTAEKKEMVRAAQAGDKLGAEGILDVINTLAPSRLIDGWGSADAPDVLSLLTDQGIPLVVCMSRALCFGQVANYSAYPLRYLYNQGTTLIISSEMPRYFKRSLNDEYLAAVEHGKLSIEELEAVALNAVYACHLPEAEKAKLLETFLQDYARLKAEYVPA
jgi:aminodeoxyfutalosine deaminase